MTAASGLGGLEDSAVTAVARTLVLVGILSAAFLSVLTTLPESASAYTPHAPIFIDGDGGFVPANGVTGGSGTPSDPYVIEGWAVDASTMDGIRVWNTTAHFVIRDAYVHSGKGNHWCGLSLLNVTGGAVTNVTAFDDLVGIAVYYSTNVSITASNASHNRIGFALGLNADVLIAANEVSFSDEFGIAGGSDNLSVVGNRVTGTYGIGAGIWYAVSLGGSNLSVAANTISDNDIPGLHVEGSDGVSIAGNAVFGNPGSGIDLVLSTNVSVSANNASSNLGGIGLDRSSNVSLTANEVGGNWYGISLVSSSNVSIVGNEVSDNLLEGIDVSDSTGVSVHHNDILANGEQALDDHGPENAWDDGYPSGGNYWSDYGGVDLFSGPNQDQPGSDGIGDTAHYVDADTLDHYPLMTPSLNEDVIPPILYITSPLEGQTVDHTPVTVAGTAYDGGPVASGLNRVEVRANGGSWLTASGTSSWSRLVDLALGANRIEARAWDNAGHASSVDTVNVTYAVNAPPVPEFTVYPLVGNVSTTFLFNASSSHDAEDPPGSLWVRWDWEDDGFWDTSYSTTKTAQHGYPALGTYVVRLEVRDTDGLTNTTTRDVYVNDTPPVADFTVAPETGVVATTFTVNASSSTDLEDPAALEVRWDWEDDGFWDTDWTTAKTATHRYAQVGTYTIRLEVCDPGGLTDSATRQVEVREAGGPSLDWALPLLVALAVLLVAVALFFFLWRRRQKSRRAEDAAREKEPPA